jgi:hypothetical protein
MFNDTIAGNPISQQGQGDHYGNVSVKQLPIYYERSYQGRQPQNKKNVKDIASHNISESDIGVPIIRGIEGYGQFRGARCKGNYRQADYQLRKPQFLRKSRCPTNKQLTTNRKTSKSEDD